MSISALTGGLNLNIPASMQTSVSANNPLLLNNPFLPGNTNAGLGAASVFPPSGGQEQQLMELVMNLLQHLLATFAGNQAPKPPTTTPADPKKPDGSKKKEEEKMM